MISLCTENLSVIFNKNVKRGLTILKREFIMYLHRRDRREQKGAKAYDKRSEKAGTERDRV